MDETLTGGYQRPDPLASGFGKPPMPNSILSMFDTPTQTTGQHNAILRALMGLEGQAFDFFQNPGAGTLGTAIRRGGAQAQEGLREMIMQAAINLGGRRFYGANHAEALASAEAELGQSLVSRLFREAADDGGFMTSLGRYVSRDEGAEIAHTAGQLLRAPSRGPLMSEDLIMPRATGQGPGGRYVPSRPDPFSEFERMDAEQEAIARLLAAGK